MAHMYPPLNARASSGAGSCRIGAADDSRCHLASNGPAKGEGQAELRLTLPGASLLAWRLLSYYRHVEPC